YNIFNYLFPGALFVFISQALGLFRIDSEDLIQNLFVWYFIGLTISRVGSVIVDPLLIATGWVKQTSYPNYLEAFKRDVKLEAMVEVSNTYRTLATAFLCILATFGARFISQRVQVSSLSLMVLGTVGLVCLYLIAYRKQNAYVRKRVEHQNKRKR